MLGNPQRPTGRAGLGTDRFLFPFLSGGTLLSGLAAVLLGTMSSISAQGAHPELPAAVTSFGAALVGDALYVYGGHTGGAHAYSRDTQARTLWRLDLRGGKAWESLGDGPGLQGLALVAHRGKLYRLGGFAARNAEGEENDLWSQDGVACYDPAAAAWEELSPLPEPRSSFDAAVLDDRVYVVGGWHLRGDGEANWHRTAWTLDLNQQPARWESMGEVPFERRALAVAAHAGKLFAIGGMQHEGGPTTRVDVYDPAERRWERGPDLPGEPMEGFGCAAFAAGERLYVSTHGGALLRLADKGDRWEHVRQLARARFFHRMLPWGERRLLLLGGADMAVGKFADLEVVELP